MYYVTGRIADHKILEATGIDSPINMANYKEALAINHGGSSSDFFVYTIESDSEEVQKIYSGYEHIFIWENDEIVRVNFTGVILTQDS